MYRKLTKHLGLPTNDKMTANNKAKYIAKTKTWKCTICDKTSTNYNRRQIINHVNTKRNIENPTQNKKKKAWTLKN